MKKYYRSLQKHVSAVGRFFIARPILLTFVLALIIGFVSYGYWIITNGATAITKIDSFWQQVPFYRDGWEKAHSDHFVFWSWNNMQGSDYYGSNVFYYIWSPFFRIITLFPKNWIPQMMLFMNILKFAIGALFFATFLKVLGYKKWYSIVLGGILYAYSGPMIINIFFNHFNDYFAFFPLLLIASEYYLKKKGRIWLSFAIAILTIINPYFMLFSFLVYAIYLVARWHILYPFTWKAFFIEVLNAIFYVSLGLGMALFVILPFVIQSSFSPRTGRFADIVLFWDAFGPLSILVAIISMISTLPTFLFPPSRIQANEPFYNLSVQWQSLSVYAGSLPLLLSTQLKTIASKRTYKIVLVTGTMLCLFLITPLLNNIIALCTSITYRWTYLLVAFILIPIVHIIEHFDRIDRNKLKKNAMFIALAMVFFILFPTFLGPISYISESVFISFIVRNGFPTFLFLALTTFILFYKPIRKWMWPLLVIITMIQSSFSTAMFIGYNSAPTGNVVSHGELEKRQTRADIIDEIVTENNINRLKERFWVDEFSQTDFSQFAFNHSLYYNINNQLIYHSLYNSSTNPYYNVTHGFSENQTFWARNVEVNQVYFNNLNINFIITQNPNPNFIPSQFRKIQEKETTIGKYFVYKNSHDAFFKSYTQTQTISPVDIQNSYPPTVPKLLNDYLVIPSEADFMSQTAIDHRDAYLEQTKKTLAQIGNLVWTSGTEFTIFSPTTYTFKSETESGDYTFYNAKDTTIFVNDRKLDTSNYCLPETARASIPCKLIAVPFQKGDTIKIEFTPGNFSILNGNRFGFVKNTFTDYTRAREQQQINYSFSSFHENGFTAELEVTHPESFTYMAVPYADGQKFLVDGVETTPIVVNGGYLAFKLPVGKHTLQMSYVTPGFFAGGLASAACLVISVLLLGVHLIKQFKTKKAHQPKS